MSTVADIFQKFEIEDPSAWIASERVSEKPSEIGIWCELISYPPESLAFNGAMKETLAECAMRFDKSTLPKGRPSRILVDMMREDIALYWVCERCAVAVSSNEGLYIDMTGSAPSDSPEVGMGQYAAYDALLASWKLNPDREQAYRAREFMCEQIQLLLNELK